MEPFFPQRGARLPQKMFRAIDLKGRKNYKLPRCAIYKSPYMQLISKIACYPSRFCIVKNTKFGDNSPLLTNDGHARTTIASLFLLNPGPFSYTFPIGELFWYEIAAFSAVFKLLSTKCLTIVLKSSHDKGCCKGSLGSVLDPT